MEDAATAILDVHRTMAISTSRADGWPQTTIVGYANQSLAIFFLIFRDSQKFANIARDNRISIAIGEEPPDIHMAKAVYAGAIALEVVEPEQRDRAWRLIVERHPNLMGAKAPDWSRVALMRADCLHLSVLDYTKGLGHSDALHLVRQGDER